MSNTIPGLARMIREKAANKPRVDSSHRHAIMSLRDADILALYPVTVIAELARWYPEPGASIDVWTAYQKRFDATLNAQAINHWANKVVDLTDETKAAKRSEKEDLSWL